MCSLEHLCVVAVPTTGCFQYVCHLTYIFCSIGVLQLVAATMCVLSAVLTSMRSCFCVLHVCMCWYLYGKLRGESHIFCREDRVTMLKLISDSQ